MHVRVPVAAVHIAAAVAHTVDFGVVVAVAVHTIVVAVHMGVEVAAAVA